MCLCLICLPISYKAKIVKEVSILICISSMIEHFLNIFFFQNRLKTLPIPQDLSK